MMRDETDESCWCCLTYDDTQVGLYTAHQAVARVRGKLCFGVLLWACNGRRGITKQMSSKREKTVLTARRQLLTYLRKITTEE